MKHFLFLGLMIFISATNLFSRNISSNQLFSSFEEQELIAPFSSSPFSNNNYEDNYGEYRPFDVGIQSESPLYAPDGTPISGVEAPIKDGVIVLIIFILIYGFSIKNEIIIKSVKNS